jgi:hypothetical protein
MSVVREEGEDAEEHSVVYVTTFFKTSLSSSGSRDCFALALKRLSVPSLSATFVGSRAASFLS